MGSPVGDGLWAVGTWVWHVRTKRGPWVVIKDDGGDVVYVDSSPNSPATVMDAKKVGTSHRKISIGHPDVAHHYRSMLTDKEPMPKPHWSTKVDWEKFGTAFGAGIVMALVAAFLVFVLWLELGAPH